MLCERDATRIAHKKSAANLFFQANNLRTNRGLAQIQSTASASKAPHVGDSNKCMKQCSVERIVHLSRNQVNSIN